MFTLHNLIECKEGIQQSVIDPKVKSKRFVRKNALDVEIFWPRIENLYKLLSPIQQAICKLESDSAKLSGVPEEFSKIMNLSSEFLLQSPLS